MKICPKCQANVEGLIFRCDCCGASLEQKKHFFTCSVYELPQCLGFSKLTRKMIDALQPANHEAYENFLVEVGIRMVCYPESILEDGNIKIRLYYSPKKKLASMTITVNYNDFVKADRKEKGSLIANALLQGVHLLQIRLHKNQLCIDDIVAHADAVLNKYII